MAKRFDWAALKANGENETAVTAEFEPLERQLMLALLVSLSWTDFENVTDASDRNDLEDVINGAIEKLS